ncbi:zf-HC2 domain-containing protein [Streptomyces sp. NPDC052069]|uniref:zf-HC2 domain-containing protein n=1 Tax=unclassified Streptomyces TaxID=2593676 RepID=UPI003417D475
MSDHEGEPFGPDLPDLPDHFDLPDLADLPDLSDLADLPDLSDLPGLPGLFTRPGEGPAHDAAAAYALGVLDDAGASAFEAHLAGCARCAARLDGFAGMEPVLAMLAGAPAAASTDVSGARPLPRLSPEPRPRLLDGLLGEVARGRKARRRRARYLVAAAAALIVGGPVIAVAVTAGAGADGGSVARGTPYPTGPAEDAFPARMEKVRATDPTTEVDATVGMEAMAWGTRTVLELKNVEGPRKCTLIAVSRRGEEEVVTSWSVPEQGYGTGDSPYGAATAPLYVQGGAAMARADIDHFEVRTFDGRRLVEIDT